MVRPAPRLSSIADVPIQAWGLSEETSGRAILPSVPLHASGSPSSVTPLLNPGTVTPPSLLNNDNAGVIVALARTVPVLDGATELASW
ncbi:hypothetical protein Acr_04g0004660 [Actinidia rufa]|uniref:Uncharacterized protein n=1 Tax=Actinidia rufa TaxID=165716 RepID=A0A7J0EGW2_9ERIC|nr:hypothetical protein Acr_04g0004660 [Actinidia rufa]